MPLSADVAFDNQCLTNYYIFMKKFLLSFTMLLCATVAAMSAEVTFDFTTNDYNLTRQSENNAPYIDSNTEVNQKRRCGDHSREADYKQWIPSVERRSALLP